MLGTGIAVDVDGSYFSGAIAASSGVAAERSGPAPNHKKMTLG